MEDNKEEERNSKKPRQGDEDDDLYEHNTRNYHQLSRFLCLASFPTCLIFFGTQAYADFADHGRLSLFLVAGTQISLVLFDLFAFVYISPVSVDYSFEDDEAIEGSSGYQDEEPYDLGDNGFIKQLRYDEAASARRKNKQPYANAPRELDDIDVDVDVDNMDGEEDYQDEDYPDKRYQAEAYEGEDEADEEGDHEEDI